MGTGIWKWNCYCGEAKLKEQAAFLLGGGQVMPVQEFWKDQHVRWHI